MCIINWIKSYTEKMEKGLQMENKFEFYISIGITLLLIIGDIYCKNILFNYLIKIFITFLVFGGILNVIDEIKRIYYNHTLEKYMSIFIDSRKIYDKQGNQVGSIVGRKDEIERFSNHDLYHQIEIDRQKHKENLENEK